MGIHFAAGVNLSSSRGIRLGRKIGGSGGDPLAGIPLALRLQTHSGFGATPNAPIGLYQNYFAGAKFLMPTIAPGSTSLFAVSIDGGIATATFSFAPADPMDGSIYLGVASGDPVLDGATLSAGINANLFANCTSTSDGSGNVVTTSLDLTSTSSVSWSLPGFITVANNFPSVSGATPATADGDPIAAWADVLGTSGLIAVQSDPTKQPVLRFTGGVPWIEFDGVDDYMLIRHAFQAQPFEVYVLGSIDSTDAGADRFFDTISGTRVVIGKQDASNMLMFAGSALISAASFPSPFTTWMGSFDGVSSVLRADGVQQVVGDAGVGDLSTGIVLGAEQFLSSGNLNGGMVAFLIPSAIGSMAIIQPYLTTLAPP